MANLLLGRLQAFGLSDVGRKRTLNEDSFAIDEPLGLMLIADGMGGHEAGEVASREAVAAIRVFVQRADFEEDADATEEFQPEDDEDRTWEDLPNPFVALITGAVQHANETLYAMNRAKGNPDGYGMGTTIVGFWVPGALRDAIVFNVGDSRLYLHRGGKLSQLTQDHTLYQQWLDCGQLGPAPQKNIVMRCLGMSQQAPPYWVMHSLRPGDIILLCSDGLTSMVADEVIEEILCHTDRDGLQASCEQLVRLANEAGGIDNTTLILACYT